MLKLLRKSVLHSSLYSQCTVQTGQRIPVSPLEPAEAKEARLQRMAGLHGGSISIYLLGESLVSIVSNSH